MASVKGSLVVGICALVVFSCSKQKAPEGDASAPPGRTPYVKPTPSTPYGAQVLHKTTCGDAGALPYLDELDAHCGKCPPGEHCKVTNVHGRSIGTCAKSTCQGDADCPGALCACGPPNACIPGNCRGPDDCGGRECAANRGRYGHGLGQFCRTDADTCATHEHCGPGMECRYEGGRFGCAKEIPPPPAG